MFDFETRFWVTVTPTLAAILVGVVLGLVLDRPLLIVGAVFAGGAWALAAYATCTYLGYGIGDVPEYDPEG